MTSKQPDSRFLAAVRKGLAESGWGPSQPLVVAFSGGSDSTALLLACSALAAGHDGTVYAAHFDHRIRADSGRDREVIDYLADQLGVSVIAGVGDVPEFARSRSMSIETAARELRYRFLADAVQQAGAQGVATGHTLDDQAETVLMNVLRGAGTRGLAGMRRRFERAAGKDWPAVTVLRPLLDLRHSDCEEACRASGLQWLEDPSNRDMSFMRNRVRHELLPLAEKVRPGTAEALARLAENAREADAVLRELASTGAPIVALDGAATVNRLALRSMHPALQTHAMAALYETAAGGLEGLEQDHLIAMRELAAGDSGTELALPGGLVFRVDYESCSVSRKEQEADTDRPTSVPDIALRVPGEAELPGRFTLTTAVVAPPPDPSAFGPNVAHVSAAAVSGPLRVRARNDGDRFHPLGMDTAIRLQDFFVNAHVPERFRDRVPLVESDRGIVWVVGYRIAEWARLDESSDKAVRLELSRPEDP